MVGTGSGREDCWQSHGEDKRDTEELQRSLDCGLCRAAGPQDWGCPTPGTSINQNQQETPAPAGDNQAPMASEPPPCAWMLQIILHLGCSLREIEKG